MKLQQLLMGLLIVPALVGCDNFSGDEGGDSVYRVVDMPEETRSCVKAGNANSMQLFADIESSGWKNTVISPFSISSVISMLANGDEGETRDELLTWAGFPTGQEGLELLNAYNEIVMKNFPTLDNRVNMSISNSVWYAPMENLDEAFKARVTGSYEAVLKATDPSGDEGMRLINEWVADKTKGMINPFLEKPLNGNSAVLNTVYFKGKWQNKFNPESTVRGSFTNIDGEKAETEMMNAVEKLQYGETDAIKGVRLPYGSGNYSMYVLMPKDAGGFKEMVSTIADFDFETFVKTMDTHNVTLRLPKFKTKFSEEIYGYLKNIVGLGADLNLDSMFIGTQASVNAIIHGAAIEVDEKGTEAAAATITGIDTSPGIIPDDVDMIMNRPFVYIIRENSTGVILFIGAQTNFSGQ